MYRSTKLIVSDGYNPMLVLSCGTVRLLCVRHLCVRSVGVLAVSFSFLTTERWRSRTSVGRTNYNLSSPSPPNRNECVV